MAKVRVVLNPSAVRALLRSPEVLHDLEERAHHIAEQAGPGMDVHVEIGEHRARAAVVTATVDAIENNAHNHTLIRALDAGRG